MSTLRRSDSDGVDINPRSELAVACLHKDYERANHLILAGADPQASTAGFFKWTSLHYACQHGERNFAKMLIEVYGCNPQAEDLEGRTPLHIVCEFGDLSMARYLIRNQRCDPEYLDFEEQTPLHHACGWLSECTEEEAVKIAKFLIGSAKCDPHRKDLNGKDALLHACEKGFLGVARYMIEECACDATTTDARGNTLLHLAVSYANNLALVSYLLGKVSPSQTNNDGNTLLHSACSANSDLEIITCLILQARCDVNAENSQKKTPMDLTSNPGVARLLLCYGANPEDVYSKYGHGLGLDQQLESHTNVFMIGNSLSGKTMLLRALQKEVSSLSFSLSQNKLPRVDHRSSGITVMEQFTSTVFGSVNMFDCAGSEEYSSFLASFLHHSTQSTPHVFLLLVDISQSLTAINEAVISWLTFLENHSAPVVNGQCHCVMVIGSHADVLKASGEDPKRKLRSLELEHFFPSSFPNLNLGGCVAVDCQRPESSGMNEVRQKLKAVCNDPSSKPIITFNVHCLHTYLQVNFHDAIAISVGDLHTHLSTLNVHDAAPSVVQHFIPSDLETLVHLCDVLHHSGNALLLKHCTKPNESLIVTNRSGLLSETTSILMTGLQESLHSLSTAGVVSNSSINKLLSSHNSNVLVCSLTLLELCVEVPQHNIVELGNESGGYNGECHYYIPPLVCRKATTGVWDSQPYFKFNSGWMLQPCDDEQRFDSYFIQAVLHRFTSLYTTKVDCNSTNGHTSDGSSTHAAFAFWSNGVFLSCKHSQVIIECTEGGKTLSFLIRSERITSHSLQMRSQLIQMILSAHNDHQRCISITESFIDPFEVVEHPMKPSSLITMFNSVDVLTAVVQSSKVVFSKSDHQLSLTGLLGFEPYLCIPMSIKERLYDQRNPDYHNKVSDAFLSEFTMCVSSNKNIFFQMLIPDDVVVERTDDPDAVFRVWREHTEGSLASLCQTLDQFSVLAGRNLQVFMKEH